ncbi:MAG: hypothetical protein JOZ41_22670 [Chloroflexi bacterium]|nr:hypothetical protein [Chloroflexota bacterium]
MSVNRLDHFYTYGEVYDTLEACDELELHLGRLRRQRTLTETEWERTRKSLETIRAEVEGHIRSADLQPRGPRLR